MKKTFLWLELLRIKHYLKNFLIFIPLFFAGKFLDLQFFLKTFIGFMLFSLISSGIYILNDIKDAELDKNHPVKKNRPIASGKIKKEIAFILSILLISISSFIIFLINPKAFIWSSSYIILNIFYSFYFKNIPILELFIVSIGYPLRLLFGGAITNIYVSDWLIVMVYFSTFTLFLGKRLSELKKVKYETRKTLKAYNEEILKNFLILSSSISIVLYIIYSIMDKLSQKFNFDYMYITAIPVAYAFFRYLHLAFNYDTEEAEVVLFKDKHLLYSILIWIFMFLYIIYLR